MQDFFNNAKNLHGSPFPYLTKQEINVKIIVFMEKKRIKLSHSHTLSEDMAGMSAMPHLDGHSAPIPPENLKYHSKTIINIYIEYFREHCFI